MTDVALAVGGNTDRCRLCGNPVDGIDAAGAVGLDGVLCPGCAENIVHYTPRCGYGGWCGGSRRTPGRPGGGSRTCQAIRCLQSASWKQEALPSTSEPHQR